MEYAWTELNIVTEFGTASTVVMKKIANLPIRKFSKSQSFVDLDDTEITYHYFFKYLSSDDKNDLFLCPPGYFKCDNNCLPLNRKCDGKVECYNFNDESDCNGTSNRYYQISYLFPYKRTMVKRHHIWQSIRVHCLWRFSHSRMQRASLFSGICHRMRWQIKRLSTYHRLHLCQMALSRNGKISHHGSAILSIVSPI